MVLLLTSFSLLTLSILTWKLVHNKSVAKGSAKTTRIVSAYSDLIRLLGGKEKSSRIQSGKHSVKLQFSRESEQHSYHFSEVDGRLIIVWTLNSKIHGRRGKEWSFNSNFSQERMYNEISGDIGGYSKQLFRER